MAYRPNNRKPWRAVDIKQLGRLARENTPLVVIAMKLGRSIGAVKVKASRDRISLRKSNQRPYAKRHL